MRKLIQPAGSNTQGSTVGKSRIHESAIRHVTGSAQYVDDQVLPLNTAYAAVGISEHTKGDINSIDLDDVRSSEGVIDVITIDDVPGHTDIAPVFTGDPVLADKRIVFHGQPVFAVLATSVRLARQAAQKATINISPQQPVLSTDSAHEAEEFVRPAHTMQRGDANKTLSQASQRIQGEIAIGGQEHMYLEGQVSVAVPQEQDRMLIYTSSQHPSEVQKLVAEVLGIKLHKVTVDMRRMGGGFGGKETQAAQWACIAALLAARNRIAVKIRLPRMQDMMVTGKRHPFLNRFDVSFNQHGRITATNIQINGDCGHSADLSDAIVDRAMFHADNSYHLGDCHIVGHRCRTNTVSHTAFRGFGGPQGMMVAEAMIEKIARRLDLDPLAVRKINFYDNEERNFTQYGMKIEHNILPDLVARLETSSDYWARREAITQYNKNSPVLKKGLALTPVKFGISFTAKHLNQAGALVHVYTDGSVQVNHGGTEMGQGLHTKIGQIAANEFGISLDDIEVTATRTDKVPNTSPTAASSGTDINGKAVQNACIEIRNRLSEFYLKSLGLSKDLLTDVVFNHHQVSIENHQISFLELVQQAYIGRVSLSTSGFYKTPKIHYDRATGKGRPFFYFAYGASCSEVTVDTLTGECMVERVDILHDVGTSLNPAIDIGQIEGGFIQGMGWLTNEDLRWDDKGRLISNNPATYKIPAVGDTPKIFNVELYPDPNPEDSIYHSKAVGEPPLMLAMSVWCAIKDSISSLSEYRLDADLPAPATAENILMACNKIRRALESQ
ncbi:xanthine dehydrogenase molybdopterin binding subunit [Aliiglaciecola litoralis]|uniref:Xanthine dehydrogenase molybdopterin binding subunit n=1 Tax=Aliiglaciecola litoralis TaxID=582857 RepID=A0ABN1LCH2_9ALTE